MIRDILCSSCISEMGGYSLKMRVQEGERGIDYDVTVSQIDLEQFGFAGETPENFVIRCFEFLLAREPKESILQSFDVSVIQSHFPDFEEQMANW